MSKYSPETECKKVPREVCGPSGCLLRPGTNIKKLFAVPSPGAMNECQI